MSSAGSAMAGKDWPIDDEDVPVLEAQAREEVVDRRALSICIGLESLIA